MVAEEENGSGRGIRTPDKRIMIPLLWPTELFRHMLWSRISIYDILDESVKEKMLLLWGDF